jgi:hypothetical protein
MVLCQNTKIHTGANAMTDQELDEVYEIKNKIELEVTRVVNNEINQAKLTNEQIKLVRTLLTESYRFWE